MAKAKQSIGLMNSIGHLTIDEPKQLIASNWIVEAVTQDFKDWGKYYQGICETSSICVKELQERQAVFFIRIGLSHGESMKLLY